MHCNWVSRLLCASLACALCQCSGGYDQKETERYIREGESQWAESVVSGDSSVVERILADDFVGVDPHGKLLRQSKNDRGHARRVEIFRFKSP